jgi:hypothetical protein
MEESQNNPVNESHNSFETRDSGVSFPTISQPKKSGGVKTILIIGVLILVAILGFMIFKSAGTGDEDATPTPTDFDNLTTPSSVTIPTALASSTPTASPSAKIDKTKVAIQIQNGTGITGEAAYLQSQLSSLGYTNVKVGNSGETVTATSATFLTSLDSGAVAEITQKLNTVYQTVNTKTASTGSFDVVIITGLRKGATPASSGTPRGTSTSTPRGTTTPTPVSSRTPTPTPVRTPTPGI